MKIAIAGFGFVGQAVFTGFMIEYNKQLRGE
jgi:hypothetical protein